MLAARGPKLRSRSNSRRHAQQTVTKLPRHTSSTMGHWRVRLWRLCLLHRTRFDETGYFHEAKWHCPENTLHKFLFGRPKLG